MKISFLILAFLFCVQAQANGRKFMFDTTQTGFIKLLTYGKSEYVITANKLYKIGKKKLELKASFPFTCTDACTYQNGFALATDSGLVTYAVGHGVLKKLLPEQIKKPVNHVLADAQKRLWFSYPYEGAYMIANGKINTKVEAPVLYALAATPDSNVWVGTNLGLYNIPPSGGEVFRYAEEGLEGFELPDNLVEQLFADDASNIWALMPDNMAFVQGEKGEDDIPSYAYPGNGAKIFSIAKLPSSAKAFLFATSNGLLFTGDLKSMAAVHSGEIHQSYSETAYLVSDADLEKPSELADAPVVSIVNTDGNIWFVNSKGVWSIPTKKLIKRLTTAKS